ncbi:MAG TPA: 16S rRNA (cytosine(967)-C(5))-methyltransferase RsmB [bacterium]|nr:16S rRNA (cytosine(967)-C(5))-methyltransferase RsmB [bacterium]
MTARRRDGGGRSTQPRPRSARAPASSAAAVSAITPARVAAFDALAAVAEGRAADDALAESFAALREPAPADRALAHELVYGVLRMRRRLDTVLARYAKKGLPREGVVLDALRVGAYTLLFLDRVPPHAAVSTSVEAARHRGAEFAVGFVNATLRAVARDAAQIRAEAPPAAGAATKELAEWHSFPDWMARAFAESGGKDLAALLAASNEPAPLVLRATPKAGSRDALLAALREAGQVAEPSRFAPDAVVLREARGQIPALPGFAEGTFAVQDEAAQLVTEMLEPLAGETLLDLCAAPGGKAIHAAHRGARVTALDADAHRLERVREAATRLQAPLEIVSEEVGEAGAKALAGKTYSRVLVDAPCSGTGIIRRKPDAKWARAAQEIPRLAARQAAILEGGARHVAPGGLLVYSVCSLLRAEGEAVVDAFVAAHPEFARVDLATLPRGAQLAAFRTARGEFRSDPATHGVDGFFAAALRRTPSA